jgi:hypothetical protein
MNDREPEEGDLFTYDYEFFYEVGDASVFDTRLRRRVKVHVPEGEDWREHVLAYMNKTEYWPSVWHVSDHGNLIDLSLEV